MHVLASAFVKGIAGVADCANAVSPSMHRATQHSQDRADPYRASWVYRVWCKGALREHGSSDALACFRPCAGGHTTVRWQMTDGGRNIKAGLLTVVVQRRCSIGSNEALYLSETFAGEEPYGEPSDVPETDITPHNALSLRDVAVYLSGSQCTGQ